MSERVLRFLRVSERPDPPPGAETSLDTFRASPKFLTYSALKWLVKQLSALAGLVASLAFFSEVNDAWIGTVSNFGFDFSWVPSVLEVGAFGAYSLQFIWGALVLKLGWKLRWYMVGDESLRIRHGVWKLREQTLTIANIQNMSVHQGPLQRWFGISDLEIHTAGGGSQGEEGDGSGGGDKLHHAKFQGLENAHDLRDRIRRRLSLEAGSGLGDRLVKSPRKRDGLAEAAGELAREARALRQAVVDRPVELPG